MRANEPVTSHPRCAICPPWLNSRKIIMDLSMMLPLGPLRDRYDALLAEDLHATAAVVGNADVYAVRYRNPDRVEWLTYESYCVRAFQLLCDELSRPFTIDYRGGLWRICVLRQYGQKELHRKEATLAQACTELLAQLDPMWIHPRTALKEQHEKQGLPDGFVIRA